MGEIYLDTKKLENQADVGFDEIASWETGTLRDIGKRIGDIGKMSPDEAKKVDVEKIAKEEEKKAIKRLAVALGISLSMIGPIFKDILSSQHEEKRDLFDYRGLEYYNIFEKKKYSDLVRVQAKRTMAEMVDLSKSKMWCIRNSRGQFVKMKKGYIDILNKAISSVSSGTTDFHSAMRQSIIELGGGGLRVDYGGGITRRLDTVVRQGILWGAKQASIAYNDMIGEELGCDGIEIDWHSNPRPSHEFMQGRQFCNGQSRTINGAFFQGADEVDPTSLDGKSCRQALNDFGCLHFPTNIICGVSEPTYSKKQLEELNARNAKEYTIGNRTQNGYGWTQDMRRLEAEVRKQKDIKTIAEASGDTATAKACNERIKLCKEKYNEISEVTGIAKDNKRMSVTKSENVLTNEKMKTKIVS